MKEEEKAKKKEQKISQEALNKLEISERNIEALSQQLQLIEKNITELDSLNFGMDEIKGSVGKEVLAQLGRGIFVKTKLLSDELIVDVGSKNFVKKSVSETRKIIKEQVEKLHQLKKELEGEIEKIDNEMTGLILGSSVN